MHVCLSQTQENPSHAYTRNPPPFSYQQSPPKIRHLKCHTKNSKCKISINNRETPTKYSSAVTWPSKWSHEAWVGSLPKQESHRGSPPRSHASKKTSLDTVPAEWLLRLMPHLSSHAFYRNSNPPFPRKPKSPIHSKGGE